MGPSAITFPSIIIVFFALMAGEGGLAGEVSSNGNAAVRQFIDGPSVFIQNVGQWQDESIRFALDASGANVGLTDHGPRFQLIRTKNEDSVPAGSPGSNPAVKRERPTRSEMHEFGVVFDGAAQLAPQGRQKTDRKFNYLKGDIASHREGVPSFNSVWYESLYPGVDLELTGQRTGIKYNFHCAPGADLRAIRVRYEGIDGLSLRADGALEIRIADGWASLADASPYIYQEVNGEKIEVTGTFSLLNDHTYGFDITGAYDPVLPLVIDPAVTWGTYLGGTGDEYGQGIAVDSAGNVYATGYTESSGWVSGGWDPNYGGGTTDAFVVKLSPEGAHLWSTYLGGTGWDTGLGIAVDGTGNAYVTGGTSSSGWVSGGWDTTFGGTDDAFVVKLDMSGAHVWSTYLGGGSGDCGRSIAVDRSGNVCVTGDTSSIWVSGGWDTLYSGDGLPDGCVVKLTTTGAHLWSSYLGGAGNDHGRGIAFDSAENVYVTGDTDAPGWASGGWDTIHDGATDGFVVKLNPMGVHLWSTYVGGTLVDYGYGIAVDGGGNSYATGFTNSTGWISGGWDATFNGGYDGYVVKLAPAGAHLWSSYLGGGGNDYCRGIALDGTWNAYIAGDTLSAGWVSGGYDTSYGGGGDGFVVKLNLAGSHRWSSYIGAGDFDRANGIVVGGDGYVHVVGDTVSVGWLGGGWVTSQCGGYDGFVVSISQVLDLPFPPSNPGVAGIDTESITWTWQDNSDNETGFGVWVDPGGGPPVTLQMNTGADATSWHQDGLSVNTQYALQVTATNANGDSTRTPNFTAYSGIEAVSGLVLSGVGVDTISVSSANVPSNLTNGLSGLYFTSNAAPGTNSGWRQNNVPWVVNGLLPNTQYTFGGLSRNGDGVQTTPAPSETKYTLAATPVAPVVNLPSTHSIAVHALDMAIGSGDGNPATTHYAVQVLPPVGANTWLQADGTVGAAPDYRQAAAWDAKRVTGLAKATLYTFTAIARNGENIDTFAGPGASISTADNLPPDTPVLSFPTVQSDNANLVCTVSFPGVDPEGDTVLYEYDWYVKHNGGSSFSFFRDGIPEAAESSQINNTDTLPGDVWYCVVTPDDTEDAGTPAITGECSVVLGGVIPSYIFLGANPTTVALGEAVTALGQIAPIPAASGTVTFHSVSPSGVASDLFPEGTIFATGSYSKTFYPIEASEGRSPWSLSATWSGDDAYQSATSMPVSLTVLKAQPEVLISLSHTSALLNLGNAEDFAVSVAFSVANWPSDPALQALLAGRTIRLSVMTPSGETPWAPLEQLTDTGGVAHFTAADFAASGILFDTAGTWKFKAEFPGDDNFRLAASEDFSSTQAKLTIKEGAGYAIVVLGRLDAAAEGHAEHAQTTDYAYSILRERGFTDDDIFYMREFLPGDIPNTIPVDGPPNAATLQYAIETWAAAEMTASPAPLYLVMVDHGNTGLFRLDDGSTGPQEYVASEEIAGWLDVLESSTDQPVFCIYGACYSGSFIPALSAPNRVVITSTAPGEISYRGVVNSDTGLRDGDFFLTELFRNAGEGRTIRNAFELACFKTYEYTASRSGDASSIPQHPMLDDNADGIGTTGLLSGSPGFDGAFVSGQDLGLGSNAGNGVTWFSVAPPITIESGVTVELWAETTGRPLLPGDQAWLEIKTPAYDDGEVATPGYDEFQRVAEMAGPIAPSATEDLGGGKYRFRWTEADLLAHEEFADGFDTQGTYKAYYFLRDAETGQVGTYLVTNIYKPKPDNDPPTPVTLLYPKNNAIVNPSLFLAWDESTDPNNDAFTYRVEVSESDTFPEGGTIVRDGLTDTTLRLGTAEGILNDHDYYWRVTAVDKWGAESAPNTVWLFRVRGNPGVLGAIRGKVTVKDMTLPVIGATITVIPASKQGTTSNTGSYFVGDLEQGVYNVNVTADGYKSGAVTGVFVESGDYTTLNVSLEPELINHAPVLTTFGNQTVWIGETFTGQLTATDIDTGTVLTFTSPDLPSGASLNPSSGVFVWSPTNADMGTHTITLTVTDNGLPPLIDTKTVVVTVKGGAEIAGPDMVEVGQPFQLMFYVPQKDANWVYEWRKDGTLLPAETGNILLRPSAALSDSGWYEATGWDQTEIPIRPLTARHSITVTEELPASGCAALILLFTTLAATYIAVHERKR